MTEGGFSLPAYIEAMTRTTYQIGASVKGIPMFWGACGWTEQQSNGKVFPRHEALSMRDDMNRDGLEHVCLIEPQ